MKNSLPLLVICLFFTGCVSSHQSILPDKKDLRSPPTNVKVSSSLGESLLVNGKITIVNGFILHDDVRIFDGFVLAGEYHQIGFKGRNQVFAPKDRDGTGCIGAFSYAPSPAKPYIDADTGKLCFLGQFGTRFCSDTVKPDVIKMNIPTPGSLMQELIYTGKVGNKIRFTYREYENGIARPAFAVEAEYDLSESKLISYKGSIIEVINATNQNIVYKVLKHFNSDS